MKTKNVILIENSLIDAILIKESLQQDKQYYNVYLAEDGFEAVVHFENMNLNRAEDIPDLIIANEELIMINGVNILSKINNLDNFFIPVIILSSTGPTEYPHFHKNTCCLINKPLDVKEFLKIIKEIKYCWLNLIN
ncbi:MAG: response regulator [Arenibacter algicola]